MRHYIPIMKTFLKLSFLLLLVLGSAQAQSKTEPPVPVRTVPPEYPAAMRDQRASGVVTVNCLVDEKGNVTDSHVEKSTNEAFEKSALDAVKRWKFKPARQDGAAVPIRVSIPVRFVFET
jgi:protein TonB